jgi:hypothetical protein
MGRLTAAVVWAGLLVASSTSGHTDRATQATASSMRLILADYVERFEREFSSAVAEEKYVQLLRPFRGTASWPPDERALEWSDRGTNHPRTGVVFSRRQLLSDVLLVHTGQGWLGYRDVAAVDGRAVRNRTERISRLFLSKDADRADQLRRVAEESARYNIGRFHRTLNIPTLPLSFLHRRHHSRFTFSIDERDRIDGRDLDVLRFTEHSQPTLIGSTGGGDVPIAGRVWLDAATGSVLQTEILLTGTRRGQLVTRYRQEQGFDVLVPDFMWEWYDAGELLAVASLHAPGVLECVARYGNYRRFAVSTTERIGEIEDPHE